MKLTIPNEIQLGALKFSVRRNDFLLHKLDKSGAINSKDQMIRIAHRKADMEFLILVHEALHGICDEQGITQDEGLVTAIATGFTIFLQSLGIEPDFSQIPEEVKGEENERK